MKNSLKALTLLVGLYLGLHNGYIALWQTEADAPVEVFPYRTELYPRADQDALKKGIPIDSLQELSRLLEDYLS